jgi:hypothetical protein
LTAVTANQRASIAPELHDRLAFSTFIAGGGAALLAFFGSVLWTLGRRTGGAIAGGLIFGWATIAILLPHWIASSHGQARSVPNLAEAISSAWLLGAATAAMLLGHWYLTATGMALTPLRQYTLFLGLAVVVRGLVAAWEMAASSGSGSRAWTLEVLRWGGLAGPLVMAWLTLQILKFRNTQSATGVLYAATILAYMGEMAAALLARSQANPPGI